MFVSIEGRRNFGDDFCGGGEREVKTRDHVLLQPHAVNFDFFSSSQSFVLELQVREAIQP
jgi:hypothetical protein